MEHRLIQVVQLLCRAHGIIFLTVLAELIGRNAFTSGGRAFTLKDFKSITFDGLWIANFRNYDDGMFAVGFVSFLLFCHAY